MDIIPLDGDGWTARAKEDLGGDHRVLLDTFSGVNLLVVIGFSHLILC